VAVIQPFGMLDGQVVEVEPARGDVAVHGHETVQEVDSWMDAREAEMLAEMLTDAAHRSATGAPPCDRGLMPALATLPAERLLAAVAARGGFRACAVGDEAPRRAYDRARAAGVLTTSAADRLAL
jgi:hypothetical protein